MRHRIRHLKLPWSIRLLCICVALWEAFMTGSSWTEISTEEAYEEKDLYYWLHQEGFYGETQLLNARNLIQDDSLSSEKRNISINNKTARQ